MNAVSPNMNTVNPTKDVTMTYDAYMRSVGMKPPQEATLIILCKDFQEVVDLGQRQSWTIGRNGGTETPDVHIPSEVIVHGIQGYFRCSNDTWSYCNVGKNAAYLNGQRMDTGKAGERVLSDLEIIRIDLPNNPHPAGVWMLFSTVMVLGKWKHLDLSSHPTVYIGRDPSCEICEPLAYISARHAVIQSRGGQYFLIDNNSTVGVWLNGRRITRPEPLREKDWVSIYDCHFILVNNQLVYNQRYPGDQDGKVLLRADIRSRTVKDKTVPGGVKELLHDIHVEIKSGTLVALLGVSGAGKSTLMDCLNGMSRDRDGIDGNVLYLGQNLYDNFSRLKRMIGSVPQKNTFRDAQTVETELRYDAILRLPQDTSRQDMRKRVEETIQTLGLDGGQRQNTIRKLSGGEQKRVSIGVELVADRELLCLDEPDAGLDPLTKRELFTTLHDLAHDANHPKTILVIIHDVAELDAFDQVILLLKETYGKPYQKKKSFGRTKKEYLSRGRLAYSGPSKDVLGYFQRVSQNDTVFLEKVMKGKRKNPPETVSVEKMTDVYELVRDNPSYYSSCFKSASPPPPPAARSAPTPHKGRQKGQPKDRKSLSLPREFWMSFRQFLGLLFSDRRNLVISLLFPLASALITVAVAGENMFVHYEGTKSACFLLVSAAIWVGLFNSISIVVRERDVVKLENNAGRRLGCYVLSKALVQLLLCLVESGLLLLAIPGIRFWYDNPVPEEGVIMISPVLEYYISIFLLMFAADAMGLFISCLVGKVETANMLSPYILIFQLVFSGVLFSLEGVLDVLSLGMVSRWGMEALGSTSDINSLVMRIQLSVPNIPPREAEDMFLWTAEHLTGVWIVLCAFSVVFLVLGIVVLGRVAKDAR